MFHHICRNIIRAIFVSVFLFTVAGCGGGDEVSNAGGPGVIVAPLPDDGGTVPDDGGTGVATLTWTPPTTRVDGSAFTDLTGYQIYYGAASGIYKTTITINNPGLTEYVIDNLPSGTYYFVITSSDSSGIESPYSNEVQKTI